LRIQIRRQSRVRIVMRPLGHKSESAGCGALNLRVSTERFSAGARCCELFTSYKEKRTPRPLTE
jgi:hypothetical protein